MGFSWRPELFHEGKTNLLHLVAYFPNSPGNDNEAMLIGQIALVHFPMAFFSENDKFFDQWIIGDRLSDIIDLMAFVTTMRVWQEKNLIERKQLRGYVNKGSIWTLPNGMKLRFDKNFAPMPDGPAKLLFSAVRDNMLWNNRETFIEWFIRQGIYGNINTLTAGADASTK